MDEIFIYQRRFWLQCWLMVEFTTFYECLSLQACWGCMKLDTTPKIPKQNVNFSVCVSTNSDKLVNYITAMLSRLPESARSLIWQTHFIE
jgi:hypothetical protein